MNILNPIFSLFPILMAFTTAFLISKLFKLEIATHSRYQSIDGLRGYLALFVFLHHASIWYFYLRLGRWQAPPSNLYTNFGQTGVALFFMVTGFLFSLKLFDAKRNEKVIDWSRLFISRFFRLTPLYLFVMASLFFIVFSLTGFHFNDSVSEILKDLFLWLGFTIYGSPDLNGLVNTSIVVAGVTWSLPYEWFFYLSLPLFGWLMGLRVPRKFVFLATISMIEFYFFNPEPIHLYYFCAGVMSAYFVGNKYLINLARMKYTDLLLLSILLCTFFLFKSSYNGFSLVLILIFFVMITNGNTLFGVLTNKISILLGDMSYSIYLLHGMCLFVFLKVLIGFSRASLLSPVEHWGIVSTCAFFLIILSFATYSLIEKPAMGRVYDFSKF